MNSKTIKKLTYMIAAVILILGLLIISEPGGGAKYASAASVYSFVLDDLKKDGDFDINSYSEKAGDYSLQVKQIAESKAGELFVYVYQPSGQTYRLRASTIKVARERNDDKTLTFKSYKLTLINASGVFFKYKVIDFEILDAPTRYYNISNILRPYDREIDAPPADGQTISEVPNRVAQLWKAETEPSADTVNYSMEEIEEIEVTQKVVGYCAYDDGVTLGWGITEGITKAYFVAFDTDRPMEKLISADLSFYATRVKCKYCANNNHSDHDLFYDFEDGEYIDFGTGVYNNDPLRITDKQYYHNQGGGNVRPATQYLHKRIRTTSEFIADENNKDYHIFNTGALSGTKWVLNFYEAQDRYKANNVWVSFIPGVNLITGVADGECEFNNVYDVSILRLEFETAGRHYNLGVVDNVQSGDNNDPFNEQNNGCGALSIMPWWAWVIVIVIAPLFVWLTFKLIKWLIQKLIKNIKARQSERERKRAATSSERQRKRKKDKTNSLGTAENLKRKKPTKEQTGNAQKRERGKDKKAK